jgi:hypothetical protein
VKFNFNQLNEVAISKRFASLENLHDMDMDSVQEAMRPSKLQPKKVLSYYELKQYKPQLNEGSSE